MVFLFGIMRAEARTGHERSEKNVPVARFGARVRVAALSAASGPRRRLGCALVVSANARPRSGPGLSFASVQCMKKEVNCRYRENMTKPQTM